MHTINIQEWDGEYRFNCSCGSSGNWYGTSDMAASAGLSHKANAEGTPNNADRCPDDPRKGY